MPANFTGGAWGGALGATTASIYVLDPSGTTAIEPLADIVPALGPNRVTLDTIDSEQNQINYRVTRNTLQDLTDTTSHVYAELIQLTVSGVFAAGGIVGLVPNNLAPSSGLVRLARFDLIKFANLQRIAKRRQPVMVVTPRVSLARAFITSLPTTWTPNDGDSLPISITFLEARIISSKSIAAFQDVDSMAVGNNASTGGGTGGSVTTDLTVETFAALQGVPPV